MYVIAAVSDVSYLSEPKYWDEFYTKNQSSFEWLVAYDHIQDHLEHILQPKDKYKLLMDLGCSSSTLGSNIMKSLLPRTQGLFYDISHHSLNIQKMIHEKFKLRHCCYVQGDVTHLPFRSDSFDLIIDKGTMDFLFKANEKREVVSIDMLHQILTVLSPSGLYLQISDEDPDTRLDFFIKNCKNVKVNFKTLDIGNREIFLYTLYKY